VFSHPESPPAKKRAIEKENFSLNSSPYVTATDPNASNRSSLFSIEWYRSNIPRLLRRLVPIQIRENTRS